MVIWGGTGKLTLWGCPQDEEKRSLKYMDRYGNCMNGCFRIADSASVNEVLCVLTRFSTKLYLERSKEESKRTRNGGGRGDPTHGNKPGTQHRVLLTYPRPMSAHVATHTTTQLQSHLSLYLFRAMQMQRV